MNRKIKFRGYNLKNKKWLYGYYLVNRGKHFIAEEGIQPPGMTWEDFEVDPDSVGQYVCTIYGVDFYEGDIIKMAFDTILFNDTIIGSLEFHETGYYVRDHSCHNFTSLGLKEDCGLTYTIIGNEYEEKLKISNP